MRQWDVYVEGHSDKWFLACLVRHMSLTGINLHVIGTDMNGLPVLVPRMQEAVDAGKRIAVVVDADLDIVRQRERLDKLIAEHRIPIETTFMLPDDGRPGCLETLLEDVAAAPHDGIYRCFDAYEECLRGGDYQVPDGKARVYAYCSALGIKRQPRERDYANPEHWDLDSRVLWPLKRFLQSLMA